MAHHIYVGTIGEGVMRSVDGGETFGRAMDGMFVECDVRALVIERSSAFQDASGRHIVRLVADEGLVAMADPLALQTVVDLLLDIAVK